MLDYYNEKSTEKMTHAEQRKFLFAWMNLENKSPDFNECAKCIEADCKILLAMDFVNDLAREAILNIARNVTLMNVIHNCRNLQEV